jgi:hypothetical protein
VQLANALKNRRKMKFFKYLLILLCQALFLFGISFLYSRITGINLLEFNPSIFKYISILILSFIPLLVSISNDYKRRKLGIKGIKTRIFLKENTYTAKIIKEIESIRNIIKRICNSILFLDNVLVFDYEDDDFIEYVTEQKLTFNKKRNPYIKTRLIFDFSNYKENNEIIMTTLFEGQSINFSLQNTEIMAKIIKEMKNEEVIE